MLSSIGISKKMRILEKLYKNSKCAVRVLSVLVGVRQGCFLSLTLFNIFLEFVVNEIESLSNNFDMDEEDFSLSIKYADDSTLLASDF